MAIIVENNYEGMADYGETSMNPLPSEQKDSETWHPTMAYEQDSNASNMISPKLKNTWR